MKFIKSTLIILASLMLVACIEERGPSDALVLKEMKDKVSQLYDGYMNVEPSVVERRELGHDLIEIDVNMLMRRTNKEISPQLHARAMMFGIKSAPLAAQALKKPGHTEEEVATVTYKNDGNGWQVIGMKPANKG